MFAACWFLLFSGFVGFIAFCLGNLLFCCVLLALFNFGIGGLRCFLLDLVFRLFRFRF